MLWITVVSDNFYNSSFLLFKIVYLYALIHPESRLGTVEKPEDNDSAIKILRQYIKEESKKDTKLHMTLEAALETISRNKNTAKKIKQTQ